MFKGQQKMSLNIFMSTKETSTEGTSTKVGIRAAGNQLEYAYGLTASCTIANAKKTSTESPSSLQSEVPQLSKAEKKALLLKEYSAKKQAEREVAENEAKQKLIANDAVRNSKNVDAKKAQQTEAIRETERRRVAKVERELLENQQKKEAEQKRKAAVEADKERSRLAEIKRLSEEAEQIRLRRLWREEIERREQLCRAAELAEFERHEQLCRAAKLAELAEIKRREQLCCAANEIIRKNKINVVSFCYLCLETMPNEDMTIMIIGNVIHSHDGDENNPHEGACSSCVKSHHHDSCGLCRKKVKPLCF
jgi:hypothetical protein